MGDEGNVRKKKQFIEERFDEQQGALFNFSKRKSKFSRKNEKKGNSDRKSRWRATPEGLIRSREVNKEAKKRIRETPEGLERSREIIKKQRKECVKHQKV